jgi:hypothetical protein
MAGKGMQFLTIGSDARLMAAAAKRTVAAFKGAAGGAAATAY